MQQITHLITITTPKTFPRPPISSTHNPNPKTHFPKPSISSKWGKKRSASQKSQKLILNSIAFVASNLNILPEPFDSLARQFLLSGAGGNGNGGKFRLRFGGGGGGGQGRNRKLGLGFWWVPLMISSALAIWVVLERERGGGGGEREIRVLLVFCAFVVVYWLMRGWRREIKDWVLGFSCGVVLMGLGLAFRNDENFMKLVAKFRAETLNFMPVLKKRRRARRWI